MNSDEVAKQIQELERVRSQTRYWRLGSTLAIVLIVVGCVGGIVHALYGLAREGPQQEEFIAELTDGLKKDVLPSLDNIAKRSFNDIKPLVEQELKRLNERTPDLVEASQRELELLSQNLPDRGTKVLNTTFGAMLRKREAKIRDIYPGATEERVSALLANLAAEGQEQIERISQQLFEPHLKSLDDILDHLSLIQTDEAIEVGEEVPTWEMAILILDIVRDEFAGVEAESELAAQKPVAVKEVQP